MQIVRWGGLAPLTVLLAACTISPRRVVVNGPLPSPTPSVSPTPIGMLPTPTPSPTITPTPTPTPTPAAMVAHAAEANTVTEFLYAADSVSSRITAYRVNADGSLSPAPDTLNIVPEVPRKLASLGGMLIVAGRSTLSIYAVDKESGSLLESDSMTLNALRDIAVDPSSSLVYAAAGDQIFGYRLAEGKLQSLSGSPYPVPDVASSGAPAVESLALDARRNVLEIVFRVTAPDHGHTRMLGLLKRRLDGSLEPEISPPVPGGEAPGPVTALANSPVLDRTGNFAYLLDPVSGGILAYHFQGQSLAPLSPAVYSTGKPLVSIAVVAPRQ